MLTRGGGDVVVSDLTRLRLKRPYIAMTPQWDFLNVLADAGRAEPTFTLRTGTEFSNCSATTAGWSASAAATGTASMSCAPTW